MKHLQEKAASDKHNKEHFDALLQNMSGVNQRIAGLDLSSSKESLDNEIGGIENDITQLTIQSPFTLLMMRIVEIGLPVLLSLLSIFFVLRYSLTEKRSHEIKELLKKRNEEISMGTNN